jgi:hypothetical protein
MLRKACYYRISKPEIHSRVINIINIKGTGSRDRIQLWFHTSRVGKAMATSHHRSILVLVLFIYVCLAGRLAYVNLEDETGNKSSPKPQFQSLNLVG